MSNRTFCPSAVRISASIRTRPKIGFWSSELLAPRDGLFAAAPRIVRYAHDRRRWRAGVQLALRSSCRTGLLSVGGSNFGFYKDEAENRFLEFRIIGSPGRIRTADQRINSPSLYH